VRGRRERLTRLLRAPAPRLLLGVSGSTLSGHLRTLRDAELVVSRRQGTEIHYRVNLTAIDEAILLLTTLRGSPTAGRAPTSDAEHASTSEEER